MNFAKLESSHANAFTTPHVLNPYSFTTPHVLNPYSFRKRSKVSELHGIHEQLDVGCCYACCMRCCLKCCRCCTEDGDLKGNLPPPQRDTSVSPSSVVLDDRSGWTPKTIRKKVKPAKEITEWKPHSNPMRNINTSTK